MGSCTKLTVCTRGKHCAARDSQDVLTFLRKTIEKAQLDYVFKVKKSDCLGLCKHGPVVQVEAKGEAKKADCKKAEGKKAGGKKSQGKLICEVSYGGVTEVDCIDIIERHISRKKPIKRLLIKRGKQK